MCVVLLGLMVSACASIGQIGNLKESPRVAVAVESIDGPPAAVQEKFLRVLKEEAATRQIAVVASSEANYRMRGYLATQLDGAATSIAWAWDVYDSSPRRAFRLKGQDRAGMTGGAGWAGADEQALRRIAQNSLDQLAMFAAASGQAAAGESVEPAPEKPGKVFAWLDDWAPEKAGIFRILRREEPRADDGGTPNQTRSAEVPMPRDRPAPDAIPARALAFAPVD
jgi:hypothetical protein